MTEEPEDIQAPVDDEDAFEASLVVDPTAPEAKSAGTGTKTAPPAPAQPAWLGKVLGHFKLLRLIGAGAMGFVVQALDVDLHRMVALKILRKRVEGMAEQQKVEQFFREARAAARIDHPNVIRIYEINHHEGWYYIAMELLEGENLKKVVKAAGPLPPPRACPIVADAAAALAVAHELGVIHRDIKPSNLMITRNGRCKLTDFGFVRLHDPEDPSDFTDRSVGTPQFMAPEVIRQEPATPAADVYSLGATLCYALTGSPPYVGRNISEVCNQHLQKPPPDLTQLVPNCPASLAALVRGAMAKDPSERPSAGDLAAALLAEAVAHRADDSALLASGSSIVGRPMDGGRGSTVLVGPLVSPVPPPAGAKAPRGARPVPKWLLGAVLAASLVVTASAVWYWMPLGSGPSPDRPTAQLLRLAGRFPGAPETYGLRGPEELPEATPGQSVPAFSWLGKVDTSGLRFVASSQGRHYWPIDAPEATLIRHEHFVGYRTAAEARADGKAPAP